ncbi:MAG: DNA-binding protein [Alphaproteobacteria bacterium]|nr:DNA-binding protein [Alphaproteobacteria bacterium]
MRKMATQEAVFAAARRLVAEGREASSRAVRDALGGGSLATIQRYLRAWRGGVEPTDGAETDQALADDDPGASAPALPVAAARAGAPAAVAALAEQLATIESRLDDLTRVIIGFRTDVGAEPDPRGDAGSGQPVALASEMQALRDMLTDLTLLVRQQGGLPVAHAGDARPDRAVAAVEDLRRELKMTVMALTPLQEELIRLRAERDRLLADQARFVAERDAAQAEVLVHRQIVALRDDDRASMQAAARGAAERH